MVTPFTFIIINELFANKLLSKRVNFTEKK